MTTFFSDNLLNSILSVNWTDSSWEFKPIVNQFPFCDVWYTKDNSLCFEFALAGYDKEGFDIQMDRGVLVIKHPGLKKNNDIKYIHSGIKFASFEKAFKLPEGYTESTPEIIFEDGLLSICIPIQEDKKPKKLLIK